MQPKDNTNDKKKDKTIVKQSMYYDNMTDFEAFIEEKKSYGFQSYGYFLWNTWNQNSLDHFKTLIKILTGS